jgi:hypothetical protein
MVSLRAERAVEAPRLAGSPAPITNQKRNPRSGSRRRGSVCATGVGIADTYALRGRGDYRAAEYAEACRAVAMEEGCLLLDLFAIISKVWRALLQSIPL